MSERPIGLNLLGYSDPIEETESTWSAGNRTVLEGAVSVSKTDNRTRTNIPADDDPAWDIENEWTDTQLVITIRQLNLEDQSNLQGSETDASGAVLEGPDDIAPQVALNFASEKRDGTYRCYTYFNCVLADIQITHNTKGSGGTSDFQLTFTCKKRMCDGKARSVIGVADMAAARAYLAEFPVYPAVAPGG